ncbi:MAG: VWA domain-containing protein [Sandaracinaceae bacterium]|nr:VWA domain-containing protein [Sandaracinaceae bacterium]
MAWDEALFGWLYDAVRKRRGALPSKEELLREARLEPLVPRLRLLASALGERSLEVREAEGDGSFRDDVIFLPSRMDWASDPERNELAYVVRVAFVTTAMRCAPVSLPEDADSDERAIAAVAVADVVLRVLQEELPVAAEGCVALGAEALAGRVGVLDSRQGALDTWAAARLGLPLTDEARAFAARADALPWPEQLALFKALPGPLRSFPLFGGLGSRSSSLRAGVRGPASQDALPSGTEVKGRAVEHITRVELPDVPDEVNPLVHSFEKVHTAETYTGGMKQLDGDDQLADHAQALEELDLREVVRSAERARSLLRVDVMLEGGAGDVADGAASRGIPYPEWDERRRVYREGWCHMQAGRVRRRVAAGAAEQQMAARLLPLRREVEAVRAELEQLEVSRRWRSRQLDGSEIDEDAMVDRHACLAARTTPPDRLNRQRRRSAPTLAALLLVDSSLSTDGWVDDTRVLELEIDAALVLGEALASFDIELGVAAFHSHTRTDCRFDVVKGFQEPWRAARHRLASVEPEGYTRIGPAVRHATELLSRTKAQRRLLLLLTDGKPNDYDRYEGRHGVADVRQAIREADAKRVHVHAFAIDHEARFHLPQMLGGGRYSFLKHPRGLSATLGEVLVAAQR